MDLRDRYSSYLAPGQDVDLLACAAAHLGQCWIGDHLRRLLARGTDVDLGVSDTTPPVAAPCDAGHPQHLHSRDHLGRCRRCLTDVRPSESSSVPGRPPVTPEGN